ncbi:MAG: GFA family protein [Nevskiales bacterium]
MSETGGAIQGRCHCGRIGFRFDTAIAPQAMALRRCGCSFCRAHAARYFSDPDGYVRFEITRPEALRRYRFGLNSADFLICGACGVFIAATTEIEGKTYATLNANCFVLDEPLTLEAPVGAYESESLEQRMARRAERWTPVLGTI